MKISKRQLSRIIKEEKAKLLKEGWGSAEPLSPLVEFGVAWASLGGAVSSQIIDLSNAYNEGRIKDAVYEMNPNALDVAHDRLRGSLNIMANRGDTEAEELLDALEQAQEIFRQGDAEVEADARAAGDL